MPDPDGSGTALSCTEPLTGLGPFRGFHRLPMNATPAYPVVSRRQSAFNRPCLMQSSDIRKLLS